MERTLLMIKPDAVERGLTGAILGRVAAAGLRLRRLKLVALAPDEARLFYRVHAGKPFVEGLVEYMSSGPVAAVVLEGEGAIGRLRQLVGATDPALAAAGTIRRDFGIDLRQNAVHASDGPQTAAEEIAFFALNLRRDGGA
jgi:nucleoside-diphosphate kinase